MGTAAYMAPEQARGHAVDKRVDIWSFGVVLFEMLTGQRLFQDETTSDVLASVLRFDPDWNALPRLYTADHRQIAPLLPQIPLDRFAVDVKSWFPSKGKLS